MFTPYPNSSMSPRQAYDAIYDLYKRMPRVSIRTGNKIALAQFSTPCYIGFLMGLYVKHGNPKTILEPTVGTGMLTVAWADTYVRIVANELDPFRNKLIQITHKPEFWNNVFVLLHSYDAEKDLNKIHEGRYADGVIANPPFGDATREAEYDGYKIEYLDQVIAIEALNHMTQNGRAALLVGGHTQYDDKGRLRAGKNRKFLDYLYTHYNVEDVINVNGDMYARQGTTTPIRIILINGRNIDPDNHPPLRDASADVVNTPDVLFNRIYGHIAPSNTEPSAPQDNADDLELEALAVSAKIKILMLKAKVKSKDQTPPQPEPEPEPEEEDDSQDDEQVIPSWDVISKQKFDKLIDDDITAILSDNGIKSLADNATIHRQLVTQGVYDYKQLRKDAWLNETQAIDKVVGDIANSEAYTTSIDDFRASLDNVKGDVISAVPALIESAKKMNYMKRELAKQLERLEQAYSVALDRNTRLAIAHKYYEDKQLADECLLLHDKLSKKYM